jgi:hypothetical protein
VNECIRALIKDFLHFFCKFFVNPANTSAGMFWQNYTLLAFAVVSGVIFKYLKTHLQKKVVENWSLMLRMPHG